ncbi:aldo/keto reductase [Actinocrispum wychmicini]|uniref:Aryl-alcohol dehydrogenase-like predicted oxidoreductase n=1 Tax=Actinocrispum wychmicini TaxID=1213861 RepID=A0A4R2JWM1_9PSEU|nr:aldo/keto reductase [Actinocrispum wychmicini]TCO64863.1 aryl-alcohol dehydrogenase-like predicted oxidoreductase [Actinocrispum wychmicini]
MTNIPGTDLNVFPLNLGGNVFGWRADKDESFAVLDAYAEGGGDFVDTADSYSAWAPGNSGGESETIIGEWMAARGNRDNVVVATKVGAHPQFKGLSAKFVRDAADASLKRLQTDVIDLYWAHFDDLDTPVEETVTAFDALVKAGKVRYVGASNLSPERITASLEFADREGLTRYVALQPKYNLVDRSDYETTYAPLAARENLAVLPYYSLARGFLTGKYRGNPNDGEGSPRAGAARAYYDDRGKRVLGALDEIAAKYQAPVASVALAWLRARPQVVAPIASASKADQVSPLVRSATLELSEAEIKQLTDVSSD